MTLEMRGICERCDAKLEPGGGASIRTSECTFCAACAGAMKHVCPNCGGESVRRPRRGEVERDGG